MSQTLRLLHITDTHLFADTGQHLRGVVTYQSLSRVLERARRDPQWPPRAVLATGDLSEDQSEESYRHFHALVRDLGVPVYCAPGNHDDPDTLRRVLDREPCSVPEVAQLDGWSVVLLSSHVPGETGGALGDAQLARLEQTLAAHRDRHALIGLHHAPLDIGSRWLDAHRLADADEFLACMERHQHVRGVLWGHVHQTFEAQRAGVSFLSTPATCGQFLPRSPVFATDDRPPAWRWLHLHPDGRLETRLRWLEED